MFSLSCHANNSGLILRKPNVQTVRGSHDLNMDFLSFYIRFKQVWKGPEVIKLFHAQLNWVRTFNCSLELKYRHMKMLHASSLSDLAFNMLINVKLPTIIVELLLAF